MLRRLSLIFVNMLIVYTFTDAMKMIGNMKKERWEQGNEYPKRER